MIIFVDIETNATISQYAFNGCQSLSTVQLSEGIVSLEMFCFSGCTSLTSINIPSTVIFLGINVFSNTNINTIIFAIGNKMKVLNQYAFSGCTTLQQITNCLSLIHI